VPLDIVDQLVPLKRMIDPLAPTANTFVLDEPHTRYNPLVVGLLITDQTEPFQRTIVPLKPTAKTFVPDVPQTLISV